MSFEELQCAWSECDKERQIKRAASGRRSLQRVQSGVQTNLDRVNCKWSLAGSLSGHSACLFCPAATRPKRAVFRFQKVAGFEPLNFDP